MFLTQNEIVTQLGISRGTLHRVLIDSPLVKDSTKKRVLRELERLNYTPNAIARGLKTRQTKTIGIVGPAALRMPNIDKVNALHRAAKEAGYTVILGYSDGSSEEDANCIRELRARMVDGFIALGRGLAQSVPNYLRLQEAGLPLVTLYPMPGLETDCVYVDTRRAFDRLTKHLIGLGHKDIALLLDASTTLYNTNRELGYRDAMKEAGIEIKKDWIIRVTPDWTPVAHDEKSQKMLWQISDYQFGFWGASLLLARRHRPTALICSTDEFAIGVLRAADLAGVSIPDELSIVGYNDSESARFARVPLTSMHQPDDKQGQKAVSLLIERMTKKRTGAPSLHALDAELIVRESSGTPR